MGLHDRDYYRSANAGGGFGAWGLDGLTPVVKWLLVANIGVFLVQIFVVREVRFSPLEMLRKYNPELDKLITRAEGGDQSARDALKKKFPEFDKLPAENEEDSVFLPPERISIVQEWFELDTKKVLDRGQVWRLLTAAFCHDRHAVWHILINMLCLYWFGGTLESMYGSREFLLFYLTAAVVSSLAFVGMDLYTGSTIPAVGASGAVMAVMVLYTMHFPHEIFCIFLVLRIEMRWLMLLYVIWDLHPVLLALAGDRVFSGVGHAAHLGGAAFGFLYAKYQWRLEPLGARLWGMRRRWQRRTTLRLAPDIIPMPQPDFETDHLDQILQKILDSGQTSLTDEERELLREASIRLKKRPT
jgi:membrane associated rhomboid family serine protease